MSEPTPFLVRYSRLPSDVSRGAVGRAVPESNERPRPTDPTQDRVDPPSPPHPGTLYTFVDRETTDDN